MLAGRYRITSVIGEGGFGPVYRAKDLALDRDVALKTLSHSVADVSPALWELYRQRFEREATLLRSVTHPNIVSVYGFESDADGSLYLVMEYVPGGSLSSALAVDGPLSVDRAIAIASDVCNALEVLDALGIVHRDIKPSNILLTAEGGAKLTDLGIAQAPEDVRRTQEAQPHPGTLAYKSPEQASSFGYLDQRSDIYALGLVLYEMLTGRLYVHGSQPAQELAAVAPPALGAVILRSLARDPRRRYASAAKMREDLVKVQSQDAWGQFRAMLHLVDERRLFAMTAGVTLLLLALGFFQLSKLWAGGPFTTLAFAGLHTPSPSAEAGEPLPPLEGVLGALTSAEMAGPSDPYEPDDENPAPIAIGEIQSRIFAPEGDIDRVTFRVKAGRTYLVTTANLAEGVDSRIEVLVNGLSLMNDDASPGTLASQITFAAEADGTAVVNIYNEGEYGPTRTYDLSVLEVTGAPGVQATPPPHEEGHVPQPSRTPRATRTPVPMAEVSPGAQSATRTPSLTATRAPTRTILPMATRAPTRTYIPTHTPTVTLSPALSPIPATTLPPDESPSPSETPVPADPPASEPSLLPTRDHSPPEQ